VWQGTFNFTQFHCIRHRKGLSCEAAAVHIQFELAEYTDGSINTTSNSLRYWAYF